MTDNDVVKVLSIYCKFHGPMIEDCPEDGEECEKIGRHHPLISALDEADAVDNLCPFIDVNPGCFGEPPCEWKGHAHADKLRGLHNA